MTSLVIFGTSQITSPMGGAKIVTRVSSERLWTYLVTLGVSHLIQDWGGSPVRFKKKRCCKIPSLSISFNLSMFDVHLKQRMLRASKRQMFCNIVRAKVLKHKRSNLELWLTHNLVCMALAMCSWLTEVMMSRHLKSRY